MESKKIEEQAVALVDLRSQLQISKTTEAAAAAQAVTLRTECAATVVRHLDRFPAKEIKNTVFGHIYRKKWR
eukprot:SAG31_NODE_273_length_18667_cov_3.603619_20_plen_72_part_00